MVYKLPDPREPSWPDWNTDPVPIGSLVKIDALMYDVSLRPYGRYEGTALVLACEGRDWVQDTKSKTYIVIEVFLLKTNQKLWTIHTPEIVQLPEGTIPHST
jgi:hypothetical protein